MHNLEAILDVLPAGADKRLDAQRLAAAEFVRRHGLPQMSDETWKYTNLAALREISYRAAEPADGQTLSMEHFETLVDAAISPHRAVLVNGYFRADLSTLDSLPAGLSVRSLAAVLDTESDLQHAVFTPGQGRSEIAFSALNAALVADGFLVEVTPGASFDEPLHIVSISNGEQPLLCTPRIIIRAGAQSRLSLVEEYLGSPADRSLTNVVTDIELDSSAEVHHHRLQNDPDTTAHIGRVQARLGAASVFRSSSVTFGGALTRVDIDVTLAARGARACLNGLFTVTDKQHVDHHTVIDHVVGDTHSEELYRGVLDGRSRGVFNGKVIVRRDAQGITARQASNNLLLSRRAEIDAKPELEIYADNVSCAHGATVGELDHEALFYLRSRGIAEADARALLVYAFAEKVVETIPLESVRQAIETRFIGRHALGSLIESKEWP
ncbi:MAG: Fe-S cluster assembly protein SufD [Dehalococcoidia bacterium]